MSIRTDRPHCAATHLHFLELRLLLPLPGFALPLHALHPPSQVQLVLHYLHDPPAHLLQLLHQLAILFLQCLLLLLGRVGAFRRCLELARSGFCLLLRLGKVLIQRRMARRRSGVVRLQLVVRLLQSLVRCSELIELNGLSIMPFRYVVMC